MQNKSKFSLKDTIISLLQQGEKEANSILRIIREIEPNVNELTVKTYVCKYKKCIDSSLVLNYEIGELVEYSNQSARIDQVYRIDNTYLLSNGEIVGKDQISKIKIKTGDLVRLKDSKIVLPVIEILEDEYKNRSICVDDFTYNKEKILLKEKDLTLIARPAPSDLIQNLKETLEGISSSFAIMKKEKLFILNKDLNKMLDAAKNILTNIYK